LRLIAQNWLQQEKSFKLVIKLKQLKAGWDHHYLLTVLRDEICSPDLYTQATYFEMII